MKLQGKVAIITGASMGIGEEIAKVFAAEGAKLVLCARDLPRMEATRQRIGSGENSIAVACDVSKREQVAAMVKTALDKFGRIDILVNNAGFGLNDAAEIVDVDQLKLMFDTNYFGALLCLQAVVPAMRKQGGGDIVNISSVSGHIGTPYMSGYSASKHAMNAMGRAARVELKRDNINVLTLCPGYIATDFPKNMLKGSNPQRMSGSVKYAVTPDVVARATLRGLLKRKRQVVVPWYYWPIIKLYENCPRMVERLFRRNMKPTSQVLAEAEQRK